MKTSERYVSILREKLHILKVSLGKNLEMTIAGLLYCINALYCLLQKPGAKQKTNAVCKHLKALPSLPLGDRKNH